MKSIKNAIIILVLGMIISFGLSVDTQANEHNIMLELPEKYDIYSPKLLFNNDYGTFSFRDPYSINLNNSDREFDPDDKVRLVTGTTFRSSSAKKLQVDASGKYKVLNTGKASVIIEETYYECCYSDFIKYCNNAVSPGALTVTGSLGSLPKELKQIPPPISLTSQMKDGVKKEKYRFDINIYKDTSMAYPTKKSLVSYIIANPVTIPIKNLPDPGKSYELNGSANKDDFLFDVIYDKKEKAIKLNMYTIGKAVLTITINNLTFNINIDSRNIEISKDSLLIATKEKKTIKLKGYDKKIKWKTTRSGIVKITQKGEIIGRKKGNTIVYAEIDGHRFGCAVSVVSKAMKNVLRQANMIADKWKYSQPKRMKNGYYDCSSLVWKSYKKAGKNFDDTRSAPTAANMAKWCFSKKKMLSYGFTKNSIKNMKLSPGDLVFYSGRKNGRYKGIYHVEMFMGYCCGDWEGKAFHLIPMGTTKSIQYGHKYIARPYNI